MRVIEPAAEMNRSPALRRLFSDIVSCWSDLAESHCAKPAIKLGSLEQAHPRLLASSNRIS